MKEVDFVDYVLDKLEKYSYNAGIDECKEAGLFSHITIVGDIEEGTVLFNGDMMVYSIAITLTCTYKGEQPRRFTLEAFNSKSGKLLTSEYNDDLHLFLFEFDRVLSSKGLPF